MLNPKSRIPGMLTILHTICIHVHVHKHIHVHVHIHIHIHINKGTKSNTREHGLDALMQVLGPVHTRKRMNDDYYFRMGVSATVWLIECAPIVDRPQK
jgi:hypothetical protein